MGVDRNKEESIGKEDDKRGIGATYRFYVSGFKVSALRNIRFLSNSTYRPKTPKP